MAAVGCPFVVVIADRKDFEDAKRIGATIDVKE